MGQASRLTEASSQTPGVREWLQIVHVDQPDQGCGVPHTPAPGMGAEAQTLDLVLSSEASVRSLSFHSRAVDEIFIEENNPTL